MALSLKFTITQRPEGLGATFTDTTGDYDATTNPGGWGAPNPEKSDVVSANMTIFKPDPVTFLPDPTSSNFVIIDMDGRGYPTTNPISLIPTDFGATDDNTSILNGTYLFRLNVTVLVSSVPISQPYVDVYYTFYTDLICCKNTLALQYKPCNCKPSELFMNILRLTVDIASIEAGNDPNCGDFLSANTAFVHGKGICAKNGCKGCGGC